MLNPWCRRVNAARRIVEPVDRFYVKCGPLPGSSAGSSMYAVIKTGGKQYRVAAGDKLKIESQSVDVGSDLTLSEVLMVANGDSISLGTPLLAGASVQATVLAHGRGPKIKIFKMRRRKHYRKTQGHRQNFTEIRITGITA